MPGIDLEELLVVKQLPLQEKCNIFSRWFWKQRLLIFSTICFCLIFTRDIISRKPNINFICLAPQLCPSCRLQVPNSEREVLSPSLPNENVSPFLPHWAFGRSSDHTNSTLTTVKEKTSIIFWATTNTLHFNAILCISIYCYCEKGIKDTSLYLIWNKMLSVLSSAESAETQSLHSCCWVPGCWNPSARPLQLSSEPAFIAWYPFSH